ncbi:MAG: cupin domain-containing protein [Terriglobia bacterium]
MRNLKIGIASAVFTLASLITTVAQAAEKSHAEGHISVLPTDLKWAAAPSVGPGAQIAVVEGDLKAAAPFTFRLKLPPNFKVGVHTHPVVERVTVISGTFYLGIGDKFESAKARAYTPGGVTIMPVGMPMYAYTTQEEAVIQIHGTGPWGINFLNPADNPLKK